LILSGTLCCG